MQKHESGRPPRVQQYDWTTPVSRARRASGIDKQLRARKSEAGRPTDAQGARTPEGQGPVSRAVATLPIVTRGPRAVPWRPHLEAGRSRPIGCGLKVRKLRPSARVHILVADQSSTSARPQSA
ncbi:MAG: hypothetical protein JWM36_2456 [Hyphomicrobiales bacterium]|nr:hypothetical protein [Hyphomicrobiales bacterium]